MTTLKEFKPDYSGEDKPLPTYDYTDAEVEYRDYLLDRLTTARDQREEEHIQFDDMGYAEYYDTNAKAANSYLKAKENEEDTRIVTGTTQEKELTLLSAILN